MLAAAVIFCSLPAAPVHTGAAAVRFRSSPITISAHRRVLPSSPGTIATPPAIALCVARRTRITTFMRVIGSTQLVPRTLVIAGTLLRVMLYPSLAADQAMIAVGAAIGSCPALRAVRRVVSIARGIPIVVVPVQVVVAIVVAVSIVTIVVIVAVAIDG